MSHPSATAAFAADRTAATPTIPRIDAATPTIPRIDAAPATGHGAGWVTDHRDALRAAAVEHGAVLVRGLGLRDAAEASAVFRRLSRTGLMTEQEAFAPRRSYEPGTYTTTKWPANQQMCMHHELSYRLEFPGLMLFACLTAPRSGGATAVADAQAVLGALPRDLVGRFSREGWLLVRNYTEDIGATVADGFGTGDRAEVEAYCRANAIDYAWRPDGGLRTWQRRAAVRRHPVTGRACWFNQIAFLSEWTLEAEVREFLVDTYGQDGLPFNTRFGNGDPITPDIVQTINEVYAAHTAREPWRPGDLMLVDNLRAAHGREPYQGEREVVVGLGDPIRLAGPRDDTEGAGAR